jgi:hypothetical protein
MKDVKHTLETPLVSVFTTDNAVASVTKTYMGPTPVKELQPNAGKIAFWGNDNLHPQRVIHDIETYALMGNVIEKKVELLTGGGIGYGTTEFDGRTGVMIRKPKRLPWVHSFFDDINADLYVGEAATEWYTYHNLFVESRMGRGRNRITGMGVHDSSHVRLGAMTDKAEINKAYLADWGGGATDGEEFTALDPYRNVQKQMEAKREARYILPVRYLTRGQFYYGRPSWDGLRYKWIPIAKRVPELKEILLKNLMHLPYHIEFDEQYFISKFKGWRDLPMEKQIELQKAESQTLSNWLKGDGQGGAFASMMKSSPEGTSQASFVKIHQMKINLAEGAYIEDSQEADFVVCRDMGLKPSLIGISPSKSGSSPGSGSEDRVARTNHILGCAKDQQAILNPLKWALRLNGFPVEYDLWFTNFYVSTLDDSREVSGTKPKEQGN